MIFPVIFAVVVWAMAMRWRRQWPAYGCVAGALCLLLGGFNLARAWDSHLPEHWRSVLLLFWPYTVFVVGFGAYIACLPRRAKAHECGKCFYDLSGLERRGLTCPECGAEFKGAGSGREEKQAELIPRRGVRRSS